MRESCRKTNWTPSAAALSCAAWFGSANAGACHWTIPLSGLLAESASKTSVDRAPMQRPAELGSQKPAENSCHTGTTSFVVEWMSWMIAFCSGGKLPGTLPTNVATVDVTNARSAEVSI